MHNAITVLTDELRRLKAAGVKNVLVSDESIARLRTAFSKGHPTKVSPPSKSVAVKPVPIAPKPVSPPAPTVITPVRAVEPPTPPLPIIPVPTPFVLPEGNKEFRMSALRELIVTDAVCRANLREGKQVVVGVGSVDAKIMFIGEAPGAEEEDQGEPFVGPSGQLLSKMIGAMGLSRADVYIANIMNWRPQLKVNESGVQFGNRPPTADEMNYCLPYLRAQIEVVNPALLVALGTTAAQGLLGTGAFKALGEVRGRWSEFGGRPLMVTYHPSYILRNQSNRSKRMIWEDLLQVMDRAEIPVSEKQRLFFLDK